MDDRSIIQLYWNRDDHAISATSEKYGIYCKSIAKNILGNNEDADECVNDTYLNAWNAMPTHWPEQLAAFLGKITRNLSFNKYKRDRAQKRGGGEILLVLDELAECISDVETVEQTIGRQELIKTINLFLDSLTDTKRGIFVRRYWYADAVSVIAKDYGMLPSTVSKILERTRKKLKAYLLERGYEL